MMIKCPQCPYEAVSVQWLERHMDDAHSRHVMQSSLLGEARRLLEDWQTINSDEDYVAWVSRREDFLRRSKEAL